MDQQAFKAFKESPSKEIKACRDRWDPRARVDLLDLLDSREKQGLKVLQVKASPDLQENKVSQETLELQDPAGPGDCS